MVSIAAYVLWFARGILRAGGITALFETWRRDPEHVKGELLATFPGVTTLTQLAVAAIPLAIAFKLVRPGSAIRVLVVVVFALAVVRTALFSERLALIELLLPLAFLIAAPRKVTVPRDRSLRACVPPRCNHVLCRDRAPQKLCLHQRLLGKQGNHAFLRLLPHERQQRHGRRRRVSREHPVLLERRVSLAAAGRRRPAGRASARHRHRQLPLRRRVRHRPRELLVPSRSTPRASTTSSTSSLPPGTWPRTSAGRPSSPCSFSASSREGSIGGPRTSAFHRALYGVWLVGLFEFMRILYFTNTRIFPAYLVFLAAYLVLRRRAPMRAPRPTPAVTELPRATG